MGINFDDETEIFLNDPNAYLEKLLLNTYEKCNYNNDSLGDFGNIGNIEFSIRLVNATHIKIKRKFMCYISNIGNKYIIKGTYKFDFDNMKIIDIFVEPELSNISAIKGIISDFTYDAYNIHNYQYKCMLLDHIWEEINCV